MYHIWEKVFSNPPPLLFKIGRNIIVLSLCVFFFTNGVLAWVENYLAPKTQTFAVQSFSYPNRAVENKKDIPPHLNSKSIVQRNIFGGKAEESKQENQVSLEDIPLAKNIKKLKLVGTIVSSDQKDWAIIKDTSKNKEQIYSTGDRIKNARIKDILRNNVIINQGDQDEVLSMDYQTRGMFENKMSKKDPSPTPQKTVTLDKDYVQNTLSDVKQVFKQAQIMPYTENGKTKGFKLSNIKKDSLFQKLGIKDGDVIISADNVEINNPNQIQELASKLGNKDSVDLQIKRGNKKITKEYKLK